MGSRLPIVRTPTLCKRQAPATIEADWIRLGSLYGKKEKGNGRTVSLVINSTLERRGYLLLTHRGSTCTGNFCSTFSVGRSRHVVCVSDYLNVNNTVGCDTEVAGTRCRDSRVGLRQGCKSERCRARSRNEYERDVIVEVIAALRTNSED